MRRLTFPRGNLDIEAMPRFRLLIAALLLVAFTLGVPTHAATTHGLMHVLDRLYGPKPGASIKPVVIVLDNGPIHVSKATLAALAERAH